jgi:hypothetical protein
MCIGVEKMKWPNDAEAPVLFFLDDLCNKWIDINGDGILNAENDWGYGGLSENGVYKYLENEILSVNPEIKVTFFVPVGKRVDIINNPKYKSHSYSIDYDQNSKNFFSHIHNRTHHELSYHGLTHGIPGRTAKDFVHEWAYYKSLEEAIITIQEGKEVFKNTTGVYPHGGKYCGYISNSFSDQSIDCLGFKWWCRYYNKGIKTNYSPLFTGGDTNELTNFNIKVFGEREVIDIPTTIPGNLFNKRKYRNPVKILKRRMNKKKELKTKLNEIDFLLSNNLIISIQEHISPSREDGRRQTPNLFDDVQSLKIIFNYLKKHNVWYCTASELYSWVKSNGC